MIGPSDDPAPADVDNPLYPLQISIGSLTGVLCTIEAERSWTVLCLKKAIEADKEIHIEKEAPSLQFLDPDPSQRLNYSLQSRSVQF